MLSQVPKIILYGISGAGKDTHGQSIAKKLNIPHISAGQIHREAAEQDTPEAEIIAQHIKQGTMVPLAITSRFMKERVTSFEFQATGYIVNGYPRTIEAFRDFLNFDQPSLVILLVIPDKVAEARLLERGRADDTPETVAARIRRYHEIEEPVYEYIQTKTNIPFFVVDSSGETEQVDQEIVETIKRVLR